MTESNCPICNRPLRREGVSVTVSVPDNATHAPAPPGAEVLYRGKLRRSGRDIVQDIHIWTGKYVADWAPFCSVTCAARFAVDAWASGVRPGQTLALAAPPPDKMTEAEGWAAIATSLKGDLTTPRIASEVAKRLPTAPEVRTGPMPGDEDWHPPGKPPPVPGVFRYGPHGRRVDMSPEAVERRRLVMLSNRKDRRVSSGSRAFPGAADETRKERGLTDAQWMALPKKERDRLRQLWTRKKLKELGEKDGKTA